MESTPKRKSKGPLRWEAIVPAGIFFLLVAGYMHFFFDGHLKKLVEFGATRAHGAEVNISSLKIKLLGTSLEIEGVQVTDIDQPSRNLFEIGRIHFNLLGDALLRAKVVVENADVLNIKIHSPRKRPGKVLPKSQEPPITDEAKEITLAELDKNFGQSVLGDLGQILGGIKPEDQLKAMEAELKSSAKIKELEAALKAKESQWRQDLAGLPSDQDLKGYEEKFKAIQKDRFKDIKELETSVKAFDALYKAVDKDVKAVEETSKGVSEYLKWVDSQIKESSDLAKSDVQGLLSKLNIPSLDSESLTQALFAGLVLAKIKPLFGYLEKAEGYLPTKRKQEQPITPRERQVGRNFQFPITTGYPLFWLKSSVISSKSAPGSEYGDFEGSLTNVTDNPRFVGKPAIFELKGDVPAHELRGLFANITVDHTGDIPYQSLDVRVASYPVPEQILTESDKVKFGFSKARGSASLKGQFSPGSFGFDFINEFLEPSFVIEASSSSLKSILERAASGIQKLDLRARLEFQNKKLSINMRSNLGGELEKAIKNEISSQIQSAKDQVQKYVTDAYTKQRQNLDQLLGSVEKQIGVPLTNKKTALNEGQKKIDQAKDQAIKQQTKGAEDKLKEEGKKLLKGLGF